MTAKPTSTTTPDRHAPELSPDLAELVTLATAARSRAYAPYSRFFVGAAVRTSDGQIYTGANVENASYGLSVCAERTAILQAVGAGARGIAAVAVCTELDPPAAPCGMCRQTLSEFAVDCPVILCTPEGLAGPLWTTRLSELLPHAFRRDELLEYQAEEPPASPQERASR